MVFTLGYLWRDRDGVAFLTVDELKILIKFLWPMASAGQDLAVVDTGAGEAEGEALAKLERLHMVQRGCLTERGKAIARACQSNTAAFVPARP